MHRILCCFTRCTVHHISQCSTIAKVVLYHISTAAKMETWFNEEQLAVINSVFRTAGIDSEPWLKKLKKSVQNAVDSGISPDQEAQIECAIYQDFFHKVGLC